MDQDQFATCFGFENYEEMLGLTTTVIEDGDCKWNITKLPMDRLLVWNTTELGDDRVEVFFDRKEAVEYIQKLHTQKNGNRRVH